MIPAPAEPVTSCPARRPPSPPPWRPKDEVPIYLLIRERPHLGLHQLKQVQTQLFRRCLHHDVVLVTKLVSSCSSSGTMDYAARLFRSLPCPDLVLCNAMLKGYTFNSCPDTAILFYVREVLRGGLSPDHYTFPYVLKACAALSDAELGAQVHGSLVKRLGVCGDVFVLNSLLDMYLKCGVGGFADRVFQGIQEPNTTTWNIMISGFLNLGDLGGAKELFDKMPRRDVVSWNTLLSAYAKVGEMEAAKKIFDEMPTGNLVSWNALIAGFCQNGQAQKALSVFSEMLSSGIQPDSTTMLSVLSASCGVQSLQDDLVKKIVTFARSMNSVTVSTALLNFYAKIGRIDEAREVFDEIPEKDLVTWNAMITAYSQNGRPLEAIELFRVMQRKDRGDNLKPDGVTMVSLIDSCSQLGALKLGEWIHDSIRKNMIELDVFLGTALIDMYAKCGDLEQARLLFSAVPQRDLPLWNSMINAMAIHGQGSEALEIFDLMGRSGAVPNEVTFIGVLSACSHSGLVTEGMELFHLMQQQYGVVPRIEHYGCVVDLLGRAGHLEKACGFIRSMPIEPDSVIWGALLAACSFHQNIKLAEAAARQLADLDPAHDGNYVLLSNAYASAGEWGDVEKVRAHMRACQIQKTPGHSSVELGGVVHEFVAGDRTHPRSQEIYDAWDELVKHQLKPMGYEPDTGALLRNLDKEDKEEALSRHSEKLALSFALISSTDGSPIRVVKNLRICSDCHRAMELVSKLKERDIIVRDRKRFHHFRCGTCSCGGYW